jgi:hypothetical protein
LKSEDVGKFQTKNKIEPSYTWLKSNVVTIYNTFFQMVPISISPGEDYLVTSSIPVEGNCFMHTQHCRTFRKGQLIWTIPKALEHCGLELQKSLIICKEYENLRCGKHKIDLDLVKEVKICGRRLWETAQGPYIEKNLYTGDQRFHKPVINGDLSRKEQIQYDEARELRDYQKKKGNIEDLGSEVKFQFLADRSVDQFRHAEQESEILLCRLGNRWTKLASELARVFPQIVIPLIHSGEVSVSLHGDLLAVHHCHSVVTYRLLEDDACSNDFKIEYQLHGKTYPGYLEPVTHKIRNHTIRRKNCDRTKYLIFKNTTIDITNQAEITAKIRTLKSMHLNYQKYPRVIFQNTPHNVNPDGGLLPLSDMTEEIVEEKLDNYVFHRSLAKIVWSYTWPVIVGIMSVIFLWILVKLKWLRRYLIKKLRDFGSAVYTKCCKGRNIPAIVSSDPEPPTTVELQMEEKETLIIDETPVIMRDPIV